MATTPTLRFEQGPWHGEADHWISQALQHATVAEIRHQVEQCGARLFYIRVCGGITNEWHTVGAFVLRVDGSEGVIVAAAAHLPGHDLIQICLPEIEKLFVDCKRIRYHTARPALARRLVSHGYGPAEIVCMKEIKNEPVTA